MPFSGRPKLQKKHMRKPLKHVFVVEFPVPCCAFLAAPAGQGNEHLGSLWRAPPEACCGISAATATTRKRAPRRAGMYLVWRCCCGLKPSLLCLIETVPAQRNCTSLGPLLYHLLEYVAGLSGPCCAFSRQCQHHEIVPYLQRNLRLRAWAMCNAIRVARWHHRAAARCDANQFFRAMICDCAVKKA